ncbi:hypothetical protein Tco_0163251, partial [Tanacetum coccineum]
TEGRGYAENSPLCNKCKLQHYGLCPPKCGKYQRIGHHENDYRAKAPATGGARGRAYVMRTEESQQNPNVAKDTSYEVELVDGRVVSSNIVLCCCTLDMYNHLFKIDLLPTELGSFDVIVRMDWLSNMRAEIVCYEKIVCILLLNGEVLEVHSERPEKDLKHLAYMKANEKKLEDFPIVRNFPEVFPDDLLGLLPMHEVEFLIDLVPRAMLVAKSPYRLTPSEMQELANQLKEL